MSLLFQAISFRRAYNQPVYTDFADARPTKETSELQMSLIDEEVRELGIALDEAMQSDSCLSESRQNLLKEMADVVFVVYQLAVLFGVDLDTAMQRVWESNMSKLGPDGKPIYREDGKILKGDNYMPPNLSDLV